MKHDILVQTVQEFIKRHHVNQKPLLLAFSGGPDSLALLHALMEVQKKSPFQFALAHADHGWRPESAQEASTIADMAKKLQLKLHTIRFNPEEMQGNLEAACRQARLNFFSTLCSKHGYDAVLLAHHADDVAETVLKKTLEGVSLPNLHGINPVTELMGVKIWRPMLSVNKATLLQWLAERHLKGFDDSTNADIRYLRARMRHQILPQLSRTFGKDINQNLCRLGTEATELKEYLDQRIDPYLTQLRRNSLGAFLDLSTHFPKSLYELKHLLRCVLETENCPLSRESLDSAAQLLTTRAANKKMSSGSKIIHIDRGCLFICNKTLKPLPQEKAVIVPGQTTCFGAYAVHVTPIKEENTPTPSGWRGLWQSGCSIVLQAESYELSAPNLNDQFPRSHPLSEWWSDNKIPTFLRQYVPVILHKGQIVHEFLTDKKRKSTHSGALIKVSIVLN